MTDEELAAIAKEYKAQKPYAGRNPESMGADAAAMALRPLDSSKYNAVLSGAADPIYGLTQLGYNLTPKAIRDPIDRANNWLADKTGLVAKVPAGGMNQLINEREDFIEAERAKEGKTGLDGGRLFGNVFSPTNLLMVLRAPQAASLWGQVGVGAGMGGVSGATMPTTTRNGEEFAPKKTKEVLLNAGFGGALPLVFAGAKLPFTAAGALKNYYLPSDKALANELLQEIGGDSKTIQTVLNQPKPRIIQGLKQDVAEVLQNERASQVSRNLRNVSPVLSAKDRANNQIIAENIEAMGNVSPTVNEASNRAGQAIENFTLPRFQAFTKQSTDMFDNVDPQGIAKLDLPLDKMKEIQNKFLGSGTVNAGNQFKKVASEIQRISTPLIPNGAIAGDDLVTAVRKAGGINPISKTGVQLKGEIANLKEYGINNITSGKGQSIERLAEKMNEAGYIPDNDPATLLSYLQDSGSGKKFYSMSQMDDYFSSVANKGAQGSTPQNQATLKEATNLRRSINDILDTQNLGATEATALQKLKDQIDESIISTAEKGGFPEDVAVRLYNAIGFHKQGKERFKTGVQSKMFRMGQDGKASILGGEIPSRFFNSLQSQQDNIQDFNRLLGDSLEGQEVKQTMRDYALTSILSNRTPTNEVKNIGKFMDARQSAMQGLFEPEQMAKLNEARRFLDDQELSIALGKFRGGSVTAQNLAHMKNTNLGKFIVDRFGGTIGKTASAIGDLGLQSRADRAANIFADPEEFARLLAELEKKSLLKQGLLRGESIMYKTLPILSATPSGE